MDGYYRGLMQYQLLKAQQEQPKKEVPKEETIMEYTIDNDDIAHLIFIIKQWADRPENSWFDTSFVVSMQEKFKLTIKQKKALLNIHSKCLKKEYKGACDMCRGSAGMMYLCEREYMLCIDCNDKYSEEAPVVKEDDLPLLTLDQNRKYKN